MPKLTWPVSPNPFHCVPRPVCPSVPLRPALGAREAQRARPQQAPAGWGRPHCQASLAHPSLQDCGPDKEKTPGPLSVLTPLPPSKVRKPGSPGLYRSLGGARQGQHLSSPAKQVCARARVCMCAHARDHPPPGVYTASVALAPCWPHAPDTQESSDGEHGGDGAVPCAELTAPGLFFPAPHPTLGFALGPGGGPTYHCPGQRRREAQ